MGRPATTNKTVARKASNLVISNWGAFHLDTLEIQVVADYLTTCRGLQVG